MGELIARRDSQKKRLHVEFDENMNPVGREEDSFISYLGFLARSKVRIVYSAWVWNDVELGPRDLEGNISANTCLVRRIQQLLSQQWRVNITYGYREGNRCADFLATYALALEEGFHDLGSPPDGLLGTIREDAKGVARARLCSALSLARGSFYFHILLDWKS
ncbi:hypothetical protein K1719_001117 [Acacia pycnantha]|nr:hypothetical protein K1719_001117 [Acacia pycnantha]